MADKFFSFNWTYPILLFLLLAALFFQRTFFLKKKENGSLPAQTVAFVPAPPVEDSYSLWLGFPMVAHGAGGVEPEEIIRSAFLKQISRQALLISARDEIQVPTRDAYLDEKPLNDSLKIEKIESIYPKPIPKLTDSIHREMLTELEKLSRGEFVQQLEQRGLKQKEQKSDQLNDSSSASDKADKTVSPEILKLLRQYNQISQFDAVRQLHGEILEKGESSERIQALVRAYTQLQFFTNHLYRDISRVFQARSMLYGQRLVAKYGATSEHLAIRASAWSLNNFHRIAREEFTEIASQIDTVCKQSSDGDWIRLAHSYADYDFKELQELTDSMPEKSEQKLGKLLIFSLWFFSRYKITPIPQYFQTIHADVEDCDWCLQNMHAFNTFDMVYTVGGEPYNEHLARRLVREIAAMDDLPVSVRSANSLMRKTVQKQLSLNAGSLLGGSSRSNFTFEQYYLDLAKLLESLREAATDDPHDEPSWAALASVIQDREMVTLRQLARYHSGHNGRAERVFIPAKPAMESHILYNRVGTQCRDPENKNKCYAEIRQKGEFGEWCNNALSYGCERIFPNRYPSQPCLLACRYADLENVRDMTQLSLIALEVSKDFDKSFFVERLVKTCPNNPMAIEMNLRSKGNYTTQQCEEAAAKYVDFPGVRKALVDRLFGLWQVDPAIKLLEEDFERWKFKVFAESLIFEYSYKNEYDKCKTVLETFLKSPEADRVLDRFWAEAGIGGILSYQSRFDEAEPYFVRGASSYDARRLALLSRFYEIVGKPEESLRVAKASQNNYPESDHYGLWAMCYRMNLPEMKQFADIVQNEKIYFPYQLVFSRCMDLPLPERFADPYLEKEFFREADGYIGHLLFLDALESGDRETALRYLKYLRYHWWEVDDHDPISNAKKQTVSYGFRHLASVFEADLRSESPGNLYPKELDVVLRKEYKSIFVPQKSQEMLYLIGRYYDHFGKSEEARDSYRRILACHFPVWEPAARTLAVKELRKSGMTDEEYFAWSLEDPRLPLNFQTQVLREAICQSFFREYSDSPSGAVLDRPIVKEPVYEIPDFGPNKEFEPGYYDVERIVFHGETIPKTRFLAHWYVMPKDAWGFESTAFQGWTYAERGERREDGVYPITLSNREPIRGLLSFHKGGAVLVLGLEKGLVPNSLNPTPESHCLRIEMKRISDYPPIDRKVESQKAGKPFSPNRN